MTTYRSSTPAVGVKVITKFPARVEGDAGVAVSKANGIWTIGLDAGSLVSDEAPDANTLLVAYDSTTETYVTVPSTAVGGGGGGSGDVVGPVSSVDGYTPIWSGTGGDTLAGGYNVTTYAKTLLDDADAAAVRATLGLVIGTNVQAYSAVLAATTASFLTADETKLDGIEANADVTDATNVGAAGAFMKSVDDLDDITAGTTNKHFTDSEKTKLAAISGTNTGDQTISLTGDVTGSGTGSFAATIASNAITTGKINDAAVTKAKIENSAGLSVPGRSANSSGVLADITAANDGEVLRRNGTSIGFGTLITASYGASSITLAKIANGTALSVLGVTGNAGAAYADIVAGSDGHVLRRSGSTVVFATIATASIADNAVTLAKLATQASGTVLANVTGGSAVPTAATPSAVLDVIGSTRGQIAYRGALAWSALSPGTADYVLTSAGAGADPVWASPVSCAFSAYAAAFEYTACATDTATKLILANTLVNQRTCYNVANGRWTPDKAGNYVVGASMYGDTGGGGDPISLLFAAIYKNGAEIKKAGFAINATYGSGQVETLIPMNGTTDYLEFYVLPYIGGTGDDLNVGSEDNSLVQFWGHLI